MTGPEGWYEPVGTAGARQMFRLFGRDTRAAVLDSLFVVVENDSYDIPVYGRDGVVRDTLRPRVVPEPTPLGAREADFARRTLLDSWDLGSVRGEVERMLTAMGLPEHLPPYGRLSLGYPNHPPITAADGLVWALRYGGFPRQGIEPEGPEWFVFRPGTGQIATLSSPDDVVLFDVAGDLAAVLRAHGTRRGDCGTAADRGSVGRRKCFERGRARPAWLYLESAMKPICFVNDHRLRAGAAGSTRLRNAGEHRSGWARGHTRPRRRCRRRAERSYRGPGRGRVFRIRRGSHREVRTRRQPHGRAFLADRVV